jgi:multidrug efflux pump subunit AcrA (membrane-fusion protein)
MRIISLAAVVVLCAAAMADEAPKAGEKKTHTAVRGNLTVTIEGDATLESVDAFEVRVRPKAYVAEWAVASSVENGQVVKKGDVVLEIESSGIKRELVAAESELMLAKANARKAEEDARLGEMADRLAMAESERSLENAKVALKWFEEKDGPNMLKQAEIQLKGVMDNIEDQEDELAQLKKMYKSEELTSATADIVIKRAVRQLERSKQMSTITQDHVAKTKEVSMPQGKEAAEMAVKKADVALAQLKVAQAQGAVARSAAVTGAQVALGRAEQKVADLRADLEQMSVKSPVDGVVYWGGLAGGQWQNNAAKALKRGEKVAPQLVIMTIAPAGKMKAVIAVPEAKVASVAVGQAAQVSPKLLSEKKYDGKVTAISRTAGARAGASGFDVTLDLPEVDERLAPGMTAAVRIAAGEARDVVLLPVSAVKDGKVKTDAGERAVKVGRTDGKMVEIVEGVKEGEKVVE